MIKILHTADWHIGQFNGPTVNGENARFLDLCKCIDTLVEEAKKQNPDVIIIAGDVFHQARVWSDRGLKESQTAINYIRSLAAIAPVIVLRGTPNHDSGEQFKMLKTALIDDDVTICTKPEVINMCIKGKSIDFAVVPGFDRGYFRAQMPDVDKAKENEIFTQNIDKIVKGLKALCTGVSVLITHYTVEGANMESGQTAFFSQFEPCINLPTLNAADFNIGLLGHIHRPQQVNGCNNVFYSGAISALNFNDENQKRGFYFHDLDDDGKLVNSEFIELPTREFKTLRLQDADIEEFNTDGILPVEKDDISTKIVRVLYNCTDEHNKAFNKTLMEQMLYQNGAFWVQEITPQKIQITVNNKALKEDDTPEDNLRTYLCEKDIPQEDIARIVDRARNIISEAIEKNLKQRTTGAFVPVEIEVKNYRNYRDEKFNFENINFCTINGENGAGKSSLFMDAMCDCLFEETREGDIAGWISNAEDARSGSIKFTFKMGDTVYRVTRTRMKSGRATLNISELVNGEWNDRSCEKLRDTQQEVLNTIGMDSLTLKATALIMQDQYGLFLTADKDARMTILGNILGLGIYDDMYAKAANKATDINRDIRLLQMKQDNLNISDEDIAKVENNISEKKILLAKIANTMDIAKKNLEDLKIELAVINDISGKIIDINSQIMTYSSKKTNAMANITTQETIIYAADKTLDNRETIANGVRQYQEMQSREKELIAISAKYDAAVGRYAETNAKMDTAISTYNKLLADKQTVEINKIKPLEKLLASEQYIVNQHSRYLQTKKELEVIEAKKLEYDKATEVLRNAEIDLERCRAEEIYGKAERDARISGLKKRASLLERNNCPYAEETHCEFLKDAIEAKTQVAELEKEYAEFESKCNEKITSAQKAVDDATKNMPTDYSPDLEAKIKADLAECEVMEQKYVDLRMARTEMQHAQELMTKCNEDITKQEETIKELRNQKEEAETEINTYAANNEEYKALLAEIKMYEHFVEDEKNIPVAEEQKKTAMARINELNVEIKEYESSIKKLEKNKEELLTKITGKDATVAEINNMTASIADCDKALQHINMEIGELKNTRKELLAKEEEAQELAREIEARAQEAADFETIKQAFSQDGIPHNIVRGIIPILEATATNILGQMSGGKMAVEFVLEKTLKSNAKKEITVLDIVINDAVTGRLPYMSRSGGERVKAALAVILALAEVKSTKAGVQLGFLFIDEPPFLDAQGVSAYCDALEAIQNRYVNLKVMAITHDPEMKSRFPQSIDVVKTSDGSKVIYS